VEAQVEGSFGEVVIRGSGVGDEKGYEVKGLRVGYKGQEVALEGTGGMGKQGLGLRGC
jgi:hypothetical protein